MTRKTLIIGGASGIGFAVGTCLPGAARRLCLRDAIARNWTLHGND
jgi:NAD(P)-dependent dehydrogenase (short-subunit alcohol dehydrogenase family)